MVKELSTRSETVTPWWWGLKTLIKVGTEPLLLLHDTAEWFAPGLVNGH